MSKLQAYSADGRPAGDVDVPDGVLESAKGNQAVHDVVVAYLAGIRAGTASTLTKAEAAGSNRKPWKQKGLGRARSGYRRSPIWRGGGVVFGPKPRSYAQKVNKKVAQLAFRRVFSDKVAGNEIRVIEKFEVSAPKTREVTALLKGLGVKGSVLLVDDKIQENVLLAARNIPGVELAEAGNVNVYQLLKSSSTVVTRAGLEKMLARLGEKAAVRNE